MKGITTAATATVTGLTVSGRIYAHFYREVTALMDDEARKPHRLSYLA
jgi:hypothetical protein